MVSIYTGMGVKERQLSVAPWKGLEMSCWMPGCDFCHCQFQIQSSDLFCFGYLEEISCNEKCQPLGGGTCQQIFTLPKRTSSNVRNPKTLC